MRGTITYPLILGRDIPLLRIICGAAGGTIVVIPLLIPFPLLPLDNGTSVVSSIGWGGTPLGINVRQQWSMSIQGVCIRPHLAASFFVISFASLIFLECPADSLFWANFSPEPPPPKPLLSLSYILFSLLSLLFLYFFARFLSSSPPEYRSDTSSEDDAVTVAEKAEGGPSVLPVPVVPLLLSLLTLTLNNY